VTSLRGLSLIATLALPAVAAAQVLDLGGGGSFVSPVTASNAGRSVSWFWDNLSADNTLGNIQCNVGFFALGTMSGGCGNQAAGTFANQGGFAGGDGWAGASISDPAPFMFSGSFGYDLRLVGSLAGKSSQIGLFTRTPNGQGGFTYSFTQISPFGSKAVNSTYHVGAGSDWGFFIRNSFNPQTGGCFNTNTDCSDATGGFSGSPFQQFALFRGLSGDNFLVGAEDNKLDVMPNSSFFDSDYNDYLVEVTVATPEPVSMALLASGLVGLAGAGLVQRRRRNRA
jgi:hypothetical protein